MWLFASLSTLALLSAPDATPDEAFHLANIWCGQGERLPYCQDINFDIEYPGALVSFDFSTCIRNFERPLACPSDQTGESFRSINSGNLYPQGYYFFLSWFVVSSPELSVILTRLMSAFTIVLVLALTTLLFPTRYRFVLFLVILSTLPSTGYFLFSSINPSSWTVFGAGFGWLALHAAFFESNLNKIHRCGLLMCAAAMWLMAAASRSDGLPFVGGTMFLVVAHLLYNRFSRHKKILSVFVAMLFGAIVLIIDRIAVIHAAPLRFVRILFTYSSDEPNNVVFISHYLVSAFQQSLQALGTVSTTSGIIIPGIVLIVNSVLLFHLLITLRVYGNKPQIIGMVLGNLAIAAVIMAQVALIDNRDPFGVDPRYVLPLFVFTVGWWFINGPSELPMNLQNNIRIVIAVAISMFALTAFTVAERFVDRQTFGLRILPEGNDQWWWHFLPVGPNTVLLFSVVFFSAFLLSFYKLLIPKESTNL